MPNNEQAKKRLRQNEARRADNKVVRTSMRSAMKRVLRATTPDEASQALPEAFKRVDKAAKRKVIHDNAAARFKRQLSLAARTKGQ